MKKNKNKQRRTMEKKQQDHNKNQLIFQLGINTEGLTSNQKNFHAQRAKKREKRNCQRNKTRKCSRTEV